MSREKTKRDEKKLGKKGVTNPKIWRKKVKTGKKSS